jgi:uncharacterized membrane protein YhaH (DUF805 family)
MNSLTQRYFKTWKNWSNFAGRASRSEYFWFIAINVGVSGVVGIIDGILGSDGIMQVLWGVGGTIPSLAVAVRRFHDSNRSGFWILLPFVNVVFLFWPSDPQANRFGKDSNS